MRQENERKFFYQWELNQRLVVEENCTIVQFANGTMPNALGVEVKEKNNIRYAEVPNILLQTAADLRAYAWDETTTSVVGSAVFAVYPMEKPAQYAYSQTEIKQYDVLLKELENKTAYYMPAVDEEGNLSWHKSMESLPDINGMNIRGPQGIQGERGLQGEPGTPGGVNVADDSIGENAWSSKNTVDKLCPSFTESGSVAICEPLEGSEMDVVTQFYPTQEGTPSPNNVCPINGRTGGKLWKGGKNLFNFKSGVSKVSFAGSNGTLTESWGYIVSLPAGTYTFHAEVGSVSGGGYIYGIIHDVGGNYISNLSLVKSTAQKPQTVTLNDGDVIYFYNGQTSQSESKGNILFNDYWNIQVELGTEATAYEPYCGEKIAIDFGQNVYGGKYNWTTGLLAIDMISTYYNGTENWALVKGGGTATIFEKSAPEMDASRVSELCCDRLPNNNYNAYYGIDNAISLTSGGIVRIFIKDIDATLEAFCAWLAENELFVVYPMAIPITVQLTPQEMIALPGINSLYSDMGDTVVNGKESINAVIAKINEKLNALSATMAAITGV